ncbi:MAG: cobyrinate a,c-diamide synthase, partial [Duncaniella sp.]|nr:cobyrinate a,c-diamide synthase [Duncaniella sp.]
IVYLPGGYPELYASQLEANVTMRDSIREYVESGGRLLGECGGMIYLCRDIDGIGMCGVFPLGVTMQDARLSLGYRTVEMQGLTLRGHEFHYSRVTDDGAIPSIARQCNAKGKNVNTPVYRYKNCIAGYTHLYWAEQDILKLWSLSNL